MKLTIVGCSDAFSSGGRYQSCYLLDTPDGRLMIDCGATSPLGLERMGIKASSVDAIIFTHCHGDHFGGLPFLFLDRLFVDKTEKPWPIFGPPGIEKRSLDLIEQLYPSLTTMPRGFEIVWSELKPRAVTKWRGLTIEAFEMAHFSGSPSLGLRLGGYGRTVSFSGDSGWCDSVFQLGRGADLYVIECSSFSTELTMHLDYVTLAQNWDRLGAKRYLLTHLGTDVLARCGEIDLSRCQLAEDGLTLSVGG